jgi:hypothetical protein
MAKIQLTASPTFSAPVPIPVPGTKPVDVSFTFKARTKDQFRAFLDGLHTNPDREDADVLMDIAAGWELDDAWTRENVLQLTQSYIGSARAVIETYMAELTAARVKN